jgi:hypothetical protein
MATRGPARAERLHSGLDMRSNRAMKLLRAVSLGLTLSLAWLAPAIAQTAAIEVENRTGATVTYRAASGYQGSLPRPLPLEIGAGEIGHGEIRAGFPATQGGGFRYSNGRAECDFGLLRMRDGFSGPWGYPQTRARATGPGLSCRAQVIDFSTGGDFTIRFIVE